MLILTLGFLLHYWHCLCFSLLLSKPSSASLDLSPPSSFLSMQSVHRPQLVVIPSPGSLLLQPPYKLPQLLLLCKALLSPLSLYLECLRGLCFHHFTWKPISQSSRSHCLENFHHFLWKWSFLVQSIIPSYTADNTINNTQIWGK